MRQAGILTILLLSFPWVCLAQTVNESQPQMDKIHVGMNKKTFTKFYPKDKARTYREKDKEEWLTFNFPLKGISRDLVTFHLENGKVKAWEFNNRNEIIEEYLGEFSSRAFNQAFPTIDSAIRNVLLKIPFEDFVTVTNRRRPILFTEIFDSGTAKFANSSEIISLPDDAPAFQDGFTIIKLSTGLEAAQNQQAIEGVIAHEIAHRVLEHVQKGQRNCKAEREANQLIKTWGFDKEYQQASQTFGQKAVGQTSPCED